jgi:hypothetical protein
MFMFCFIRRGMIRVAKAPGSIRDSICGYLQMIGGEASVEEIFRAVTAQIDVTSPSSVRSYLNLNVGKTFARTGRGRYRLKANGQHWHANGHKLNLDPSDHFAR